MIYFSNIGFYKANMKLSKFRKVFKRAKKQHKRFFFAISVCTFLLLVYLAGVIFGVDQYLIKTPLEGRVVSNDGDDISGAEVILQGQKTITDKNGSFRFEDVKFGTYEIVVDTNGYVRYVEKVKIERFSNYVDISMRAQEYGEVNLTFKTDRTQDKVLNVKINNQPFTVQTLTDKFVVESGRLLVGNYLLEMNSPDYVDFSEKFNLDSGKSEMVYDIEPSGDVVAEFRNYLSEDIVEPGEIIVTMEEQIVVIPEIETPGKLEMRDMEIGKEYRIQLKLSGYLDREVEFVPTQGLNSLGNIFMFVNESVIYTDRGKIVSSFIDGSNRKELYDFTDKCRISLTKGQYSVFSCSSSFLLFEKKGNEYNLIREYVITGSKYDLNTQNLHMLALSADLKSIQQIHSSINTTDLYKHNKEIDSVVVDSKGMVYFSDNEAVYKLIDSEVEKMVDGNYRLDKVSPDNNTILAFGNRSAGQSNIWKLETTTKTVTKITFLPNDYNSLGFEGNDKIYYQVKNELFLGSINQNNFTKISEGIDYYWLNEGSNFFMVMADNSVQFVSKTNYNKKPIFANE